MTPHTIDREEVMAYLDGELEPARRDLVEAHLDTCDDCRMLAGELRQISGRLSSWAIPDATDRLAGIRQTLQSSKPPQPARSFWWTTRGLFHLPRWALAAGLAAVVAVVVTPAVMMQWRSRPDRERVMMGYSVESDARGSARSSMPTAANAAPREGLAPPAPSPSLPGGQGQGVRGGGGGAALMARATDARPGQVRDRMIVRTASMVLTSDKFDEIRGAIERLVAAHQGRVTSLNLTGDSSSRRSLNATLGVPAANMDALLTGLRGLGR
ncbi:MAG TPA: zf-HC2 domain-containing protein, partial [Vicinamibacterales bacterium]|nr:zf-HC2 domain-containing protein [Vicinamibacterales bacterium]